jgi:hypothetical protein
MSAWKPRITKNLPDSVTDEAAALELLRGVLGAEVIAEPVGRGGGRAA